MGWSIGYDEKWKRDVGYGVPALCDEPCCKTLIDRGLSYVCGGEPFGGDHGCGLYFCEQHLRYCVVPSESGGRNERNQFCARCCSSAEPYEPKPDVPQWMRWKLEDVSWQEWRDENPAEVEQLRAALAAA